jgi:hypothetical protein
MMLFKNKSISSSVTAWDLGLSIRDALTGNSVQSYDGDKQAIRPVDDPIFAIDFRDPCNLVIEMINGERFAVKIKRISDGKGMLRNIEHVPVDPESGLISE